MAKATAKSQFSNAVVVGKEKKITKKKKTRLKQWYNKKIKLWQALLMSITAVWLFWIFWAIDYVERQLR